MSYLDSSIDSFSCEHAFPVGRWLECEEMLQFGVETDKLALIFADFFDAEGVSGASHDLLVVEALDILTGGLEDRLYFYFHLT